MTFPIRTKTLRGTELHLTAAAFYQVWVNGTFVAFGPARTALGYAREDILSLDAFCGEENEIRILVAGYFCKSFNGVKQPSFLQAELRRGDEILFATDGETLAYRNAQKVEKTLRYSLQRQFQEIWDLTESATEQCIPVERIKAPAVLDRVAPYPHYETVTLTGTTSRGTLVATDSADAPLIRYSGNRLFPTVWGRFEMEEIEHFPYTWLVTRTQNRTAGAQDLPLSLKEGEYVLLDFGRIECGFFNLSGSATEGAQLVFGFSEGNCTQDSFDFTNMNALNAIEYRFADGAFETKTFEPYTAKHVIVAVRSGEITLSSFGITTFEADTSEAYVPEMHDATLNSVARGAVRTYAHNAVDIYTDCPSRERAGWLCDSYFTGKTEYFLYGKVPVESAYLENYRLFRDLDGELPEGALPMSFPSDVEYGGKFIPQWTMWYILESADHLLERNPTEDREKFRPSIEALLRFYAKYENEDGLLESLPSWNFVEWSAANQWTQDVNYPTNFLYAKVLERVADLYGDESLRKKGKKIAETAIEQSFNGEVFLDHAERDEAGVLIRRDHCSEVCQYYAVFFTDLDLDEPKYARLKHLITHVFGAERKEALADIEPINAFIGVYMRLEALLKLGYHELILQDVRDFFGGMGQQTGTLWEYQEGKGSRDHGFASYALVAMKKAYDALNEK